MADQQTSNAAARARVTELIREARTCMFTTMTEDGRHVSRPMGLQESEFDGDLWFFAYVDSDKARQIQVNPQVNVSFANQKGDAFVSIAGTASLVPDKAKQAKLWFPLMESWFPDGLETHGITLINVHAETAEYWDSPGRMRNFMGQAKTAVTGKPGAEALGEHRAVSYPS
jgi:general stress protein 26